MNLDGVDDIHKPEDITTETVRYYSKDSVCIRENNVFAHAVWKS